MTRSSERQSDEVTRKRWLRVARNRPVLRSTTRTLTPPDTVSNPPLGDPDRYIGIRLTESGASTSSPVSGFRNCSFLFSVKTVMNEPSFDQMAWQTGDFRLNSRSCRPVLSEWIRSQPSLPAVKNCVSGGLNAALLTPAGCEMIGVIGFCVLAFQTC